MASYFFLAGKRGFCIKIKLKPEFDIPDGSKFNG
jgi:hypothetical protein